MFHYLHRVWMKCKKTQLLMLHFVKDIITDMAYSAIIKFYFQVSIWSAKLKVYVPSAQIPVVGIAGSLVIVTDNWHDINTFSFLIILGYFSHIFIPEPNDWWEVILPYLQPAHRTRIHAYMYIYIYIYIYEYIDWCSNIMRTIYLPWVLSISK